VFTADESVEAARAAEDEVRELLERARGGDPAALPALRAALDGRPELWRAYGDLAAHARGAWVELIGGPDLALKESLTRTADAMLVDLAGPAAPALERLLAERVVATWLQLNHADALAAQAAGLSLRQASFAQGRQESAQRRHIAAAAALATLRRLLPATAEIVVSPTAAMTTGGLTVEVNGEVECVRPGDRPADPPASAPDEGGTVARVISIEPARSTADRRRRAADRPQDERGGVAGDARRVVP
jgi:hypothetical protein